MNLARAIALGRFQSPDQGGVLDLVAGEFAFTRLADPIQDLSLFVTDHNPDPGNRRVVAEGTIGVDNELAFLCPPGQASHLLSVPVTAGGRTAFLI